MPGPRVETRGYFLSSLTGLTLRAGDGVGWAGDGFGIDPQPFCSCCPFRALAMRGAFPGAASRVPRDLPRAILGRPFGAAITDAQYRRIREQPSASQVGAAPRGCPPVRTGTRCRAADGAWNMSPFLPGVFRLCGLGALCGQSLELDLVPESLGAPFSSSARLPSGSGFE